MTTNSTMVPRVAKTPTTAVSIKSLFRFCESASLPWMAGPKVNDISYAFADMPNLLSDGTPAGDPRFTFPEGTNWSHTFSADPNVKVIPKIQGSTASTSTYNRTFIRSGVEAVDMSWFKPNLSYEYTFWNCANLREIKFNGTDDGLEHTYLFPGKNHTRTFNTCPNLKLTCPPVAAGSTRSCRFHLPNATVADGMFDGTLILCDMGTSSPYISFVIDAPICTKIDFFIRKPSTIGNDRLKKWKNVYILTPANTKGSTLLDALSIGKIPPFEDSTLIIEGTGIKNYNYDQLIPYMAIESVYTAVDIRCNALWPSSLKNLLNQNAFKHQVMRYGTIDIELLVPWTAKNVGRYMMFDSITFTNNKGLTTIAPPTNGAITIDLRKNCINSNIVQTICAASSSLYTVRIIE